MSSKTNKNSKQKGKRGTGPVRTSARLAATSQRGSGNLLDSTDPPREVTVVHGSSAQGLELDGKHVQGKEETREGDTPLPDTTHSEGGSTLVGDKEETLTGDTLLSTTTTQDVPVGMMKTADEASTERLQVTMTQMMDMLQRLGEKVRQLDEKVSSRPESRNSLRLDSNEEYFGQQTRHNLTRSARARRRRRVLKNSRHMTIDDSQGECLQDTHDEGLPSSSVVRGNPDINNSRETGIPRSPSDRYFERTPTRNRYKERSGHFREDTPNSSELMGVLKTFAKTRVFDDTRIRDSEEKALAILTKHTLLTDRSEGKEIQWLLNLNMLREQRAWTDERYCRYLPRLWNPQAKSSITRFFIDLKPEVARDRIKLDKEFIEEFAEGGISKLLNTATRASQPVGVTMQRVH